MKFLFDLVALICDRGRDFGSFLLRNLAEVQLQSLHAVVHREEKQNAGEKIQSQRMNVTDPFAFDEFIRQSPRSGDQEADGAEKFRIPVQKFVQDIEDDVAKRASVIDRRLPTL